MPSVIEVCDRKMPSAWAVVPRSTLPVTCQTMFLASAPPLSVMLLAAASLRSPAIWKIQTSLGAPAIVTSVGIVTDVPHL